MWMVLSKRSTYPVGGTSPIQCLAGQELIQIPGAARKDACVFLSNPVFQCPGIQVPEDGI
jgi:hypothetical protein